MTDFTNATILIAIADQPQAQADLKDASLFTSLASPTGKAPATVAFTSGPWENAQIDFITDTAAWKKKIRSPDWQQALAGEGLQMIAPPETANAD